MPRVSIIVAAYNVETYVRDALRSALAQTYTDREIIVVDDGSTDATRERVREFGERIVLLEQDHAGAAAARNRGIRASSGDLVVLLDADDVWGSDSLERAVAVLDANAAFGFVTHSSRQGRARFRAEDQKLWIGQVNFVAYSAVVRRELYDRHGLFDETLTAAMDWELWMRFIAGGERVGLVTGSTYGLYRRRAGSITADHARYLRGQLRTLERMLEKGVRLPGLEATVDIARGRVALMDGDRARARRRFAAAALNTEAVAATRLRGLAFAMAPGAMWRLYDAYVRRRRRQGIEHSRRRAADLGVEP
jgi:glycosyltransferase involved in cell wall biosynthesis